MNEVTSIPVGTCDQSILIGRIDLDDEYSDATLVRVRGALQIILPTGTGAATFQGAAGIIEVEGVDSEDILTETYCPLTDCDASWLWHTFFAGSDANITNGALRMGQRIEIDAAAKRRLEAGDSSLWFAIENDVLSDVGFSYWWGTRFIISER